MTVDVTVSAAQAQLATLAREGWLGRASENAYEDGFSTLIRVGPLGGLPGASKQVRVRFLDPVHRGEMMTVGLRWEATGITGGLFPVLDADISLTPAGGQATRLALAGTYRPPMDGLGANLDRLILHRAATATIRSLLERVAATLAGPSPAAGHEESSTLAPLPCPATGPEG